MRELISLRGFVQGVGFRPFVYSLARALGLVGFVVNSADGVEIEVEGSRIELDCFFRRLTESPPPRSRIISTVRREIAARGEREFVIRPSRPGSIPRALVSPDLATCPACLAEMNDPADRRYRYPFINCTHCGPRFTIIGDLPYDRPATTMDRFVMCPACGNEYQDPGDRRFHAQPNACPECGPEVELAGRGISGRLRRDEAVTRCVRELARGAIVAVKGTGGFHLAVNARDSEAVARLRQRKKRPAKPFAMMARDLDAAATVARITGPARQAMLSWRAPIVLLPRISPELPSVGIAPSLDLLGVMLPYTPLHHLLFADGLDLLVMTSGNLSGEPIITGNDQAILDLAGMADFILIHNRDILVGCDDSVEIELGRGMVPLRRSRGHVLGGIELNGTGPCVLGLGGEKKNAVCLLRDDLAFPGQHIADLKSASGLESFLASIKHLKKILAVTPEAVACDLHPDYLSTRWAVEESGLPVVRVQHHHAHLAACLAENREPGPVVGVVLDGTGLGPDGTVWGGEILYGDQVGCRRVGGLRALRLPGGDRVVSGVWRTAVSWLCQVGGEGLMPRHLKKIPDWRIVARAAEAGINAPYCSSCGRLFDAVAAICGICLDSSFDGEAPMLLEAVCDPGHGGAYSVKIEEEGGLVIIAVRDLLLAAAEDFAEGTGPAVISARFHRGLGRAFVAAAARACEACGAGTVALSGGCFANRTLFAGISRGLADRGFRVLSHRELPPGDGGLALGQAMVARAGLLRGESGRG